MREKEEKNIKGRRRIKKKKRTGLMVDERIKHREGDERIQGRGKL